MDTKYEQQIEGRQNIVKQGSAILSSDLNAFQAHKARKMQLERISSLETRVAQLEQLVEKLCCHTKL